MIGINPRGMTVIEWTDRMIPELMQKGGVVGRLFEPEQWREWAAGVILIDTRWQGVAPNPYQFEHWDDWAERFLQTTS